MTSSRYRRTYTGDGVTKNFTVPPDYIRKSHVVVKLNNVTTTSYTWFNDQVISLDQPPGVGVSVFITLVPPDEPIHEFTGSVLVPSALNENFQQAIQLGTSPGFADEAFVAEYAERLLTPRTINGVPFDGSQDIVIFANGQNSTFSDFSTEATQAVRLKTARNINGVPFNGTQNISIDAWPSHDVHKTLYVVPGGNNNSTGRNENRGLASIERALEIIEAQQDKVGWTVKLLGDVTTAGEIPVPDFTTIISASGSQRRNIIRPTSGNEERNVFLCGNGVHIFGLKFTGWRIDDFDNPTKGFAMAFRPGAIILPGGVPYGQNCVVTSSTTEVPTPLPMDPSAGNPAHPRGGGCVLADASVLSAYTVYPNIMTWGFTPSTANGLGYVARNRGFINPVNAIGIGAHRHFMCLDGGQMVVSGSSSQFGDYSFWSEGSIQRVVPLKVNSAVITTQNNITTIINTARVNLVNDVWGFLVANHGASTWPAGFEALTRKDSNLFLDALAACLVHGFERPMLNFAEGMFKFDGDCVYPYTLPGGSSGDLHAAFKASWDRLTSQLIAGGQLTSAAEAFVNALVARLKATMDNYWFEEGSAPAPNPVEKVLRKLRSEITAINHQWTAPLAGVEYFRVPPAKAARRIQRSIVQRNGGRVRFSGQDDLGNAVFVGGLTIDARSGQLGGPPFDSAVRSRITRGIISRSY